MTRVALSLSLSLAHALICALFAQPAEPVPVGTPGVTPLRWVSGSEVRVVVRLREAPLAAVLGANAKRTGLYRLTPQQQRDYLQALDNSQTALVAQVAGLGGRELARLKKAHNAVVVSIHPEQLNRLTALPNVAGVRLLGDYSKALSATVPYIGAATVQAAGVTGAGVKVAVLDSGVDYTHRNLGGAGTTAAYTAAYGAGPASLENKSRDGLFPTAKVYEGYDFVGEEWPAGPLAPDPDPIDFEGHGTHVADIAAGRSLDNLHKGVAPGAQVLAVKVCSAVSTSCSGIALLQGADFALDPNLDGDLADAVDVMNLSLGTDYGQREDDLTEALRLASLFGVVVVAAAGNAGDKPYIVGSPSTGPAVVSVAQSQVPGALGFPLQINAPASIAGTYTNTETLSFAPVGSGFANAPVTFVGRGCPAGSISPGSPEDPYLANPAGKVALIDRGACNVSLKVDRAAKAGAIGALIGLVAPGDAIGFSFGGGDTFVPSLVITQATSNAIKGALASNIVLATLSPLNTIPLAGSMAVSSSRGPGYSYNAIKPDIAAPGASVSAVAGTGNGETAFSGTSGAAPMIAGAAALLLQSCPICSPMEIKSRMLNTAETNILTNPKTVPGELAPITRMGAGEVRVDRARNVRTMAWDAGDPSAVSMSFGSLRMSAPVVLSRKVVVRNLLGSPRTYSITPEFRYASDAGGAVAISAPSSIPVPANATGTFTVTLNINASLLPTWSLNGGSRGGDGFRLQGHEFDGFLRISDATDTIRVPWYVLPHKASGLQASTASLQLPSVLGVSNSGVAAGSVTIFSLLGTSGRFPASFLPRPGDNFAVVDLRAAGVRHIPNGAGAGLDVLQFGLNTWGERSHPNYPAEFDIFIDGNNDGTDDYHVFNGEAGGLGATGQNVTALRNVATNAQIVRFFTTADLSSSNAILNVVRNDGSAIGGPGIPAGTPIRLTFCASDNYYTGVLTDCIGPVTYTLNNPRFTPSTSAFVLNPLNSQNVTVTHAPGGSASQLGLLLFYGDARSGQEAEIVSVLP